MRSSAFGLLAVVFGVFLAVDAAPGASLLLRRVRQQKAGDAERDRHQGGVDESARLLLPGRDRRERKHHQLGPRNGSAERLGAQRLDTQHHEGGRRGDRGRRRSPRMAANRPTRGRSPWRPPARSWVRRRANAAPTIPNQPIPHAVATTKFLVGSHWRCPCICALALPLAAQDEPPAGLNGGRLDRPRNTQPARPTPHWPDGRVNLGPLPGEKGVWEGNAGSTLATNIRAVSTTLA